MVDDGLVVFADDVDAEFLTPINQHWSIDPRARRTTISSLFNSNGSDSTPSADSLSPLTNVPFELLTSLIYILPSCSHISACILDNTFESKYPFRSPGCVLALVCRPIFTYAGDRD